MADGQIPSTAPEVDAGAQVKRMLAAAGRHRLRILLLGLFGLAVGALVATFVPDMFESRTLLLLRQRELIDDSRLLRAISEKPLIQKEQTLESELLSFQWIHDVLKECEWLEYARIKDDPAKISDLIHRIQDKNYFRVVMSTDASGELLVELTFRWDNPSKARQFVEKARKNWINRRDEEHRRYWRKQMDDFEKILMERRLAYQAASDALQKFNAANRLPALEDANAQYALKSQLILDESAAKANIAGLTAGVTKIESEISSVPEKVETSTTKTENPDYVAAAKALQEEQSALDLLLKAKKAKTHPDVKKQQILVDEAAKKLASLTDLHYTTSASVATVNPSWYEQKKRQDESTSQLASERKRLEEIERQLADLERELATQAGRLEQRHQLQNDLAQLQLNLNEASSAIQPVRDKVDFIERRSALSVGDAERTLAEAGAFSILEEPVDAKKPVGLPKPIFGLIGLLLGCAIGLAFALVTEMMRTSFSGPAEVAQVLRLPILGTVDTIEIASEQRRDRLVALAQVVGAVLIIVAIGAFVVLVTDYPERLPPGFRKTVDDVRASFK